jgi:hypothetical protein
LLLLLLLTTSKLEMLLSSSASLLASKELVKDVVMVEMAATAATGILPLLLSFHSFFSMLVIH